MRAPRRAEASSPVGPGAVLLLAFVATGCGSGPVVHVNIAVPIATQAPVGSACSAAELRGTGPKVATIPGAPFEFFDFDRFRETESPDVMTRLEQASVGRLTVPETGVVTEPVADDPDFPADCVFSFDVATNADVQGDYVFLIGPPLTDDPLYFPIPTISRSDLEAAGWTADIRVNPQ